MSNDVIGKFLSRIPNRRTKDVTHSYGNIFCEAKTKRYQYDSGLQTYTDVPCDRGTLYSYGHHFAMAEYLGKAKDGKPVFLLNGDKSSITTARHQSWLLSAVKKADCHAGIISFQTLRGILNRDDLTPDSFVEMGLGEYKQCYRINGEYYDIQFNCSYDKKSLVNAAQLYNWDYFLRLEPWDDKANPDYQMYWVAQQRKQYPDGMWHILQYRKIPLKGIYSENEKYDSWSECGCVNNFNAKILEEHFIQPKPDTKISFGYMHSLGGILFNHDSKHYLGTLDEREYCCIQLPKPAKSISQAIEILKPKAVRDAEKQGIKVIRQGEWFFVPFGDDAKMKELTGIAKAKLRSNKSPLPLATERSNPHTCYQIIHKKQIYATGNVSHPQHHTVKLGKDWYKVYKNTEIMSVAVRGEFD